MKGLDVNLPELPAREWSQASRDAKYFGSLFRRMAVLEAVGGEGNELQGAIDALRSSKADLTAEVANLQAKVDACNADCAAKIADAEAKAGEILARANAKLEAAEAREKALADSATEWDRKVSEKQAKFAEEDQKLRRIRETIANVTKGVGA